MSTNSQIKKRLINTLHNGNKIYIIALNGKDYNVIMKDMSSCSGQFEVNKFTNKWGFSPNQILMQGETYINQNDKEDFDFFVKVIQRIFPKVVKKDETTGTTKEYYKCWCAKPLNVTELADHRTPLESWNCLMIRLGEPQYAIVLEEKHKKD